MDRKGQTAMKVILVMGILSFVSLWLVSAAMKRALLPDETQRVQLAGSQSPFDMGRAWACLERVVAFGPRPAGSEELEALRGYLRNELAAAGFTVREQAFIAETPAGAKRMANLVAESKGDRDGLIVLTNHYDTKHFSDFDFAGANDGGSTTAWMLEMARTLGPSRRGATVWLVWLDGEEAWEKWGPGDSLYGSRAFVRHLRETGELEKIGALVNLDMIGDAYLGIHRDPDAPRWLLNSVWGTAMRLGYGRHFLDAAKRVQDDHLPFREAGIPALEVIDFSYGGSMAAHQRNWHTSGDTLDKVRAESLKAVGDVLYHSLTAIEAGMERRHTERAQ